jgi:hypothetical protein
MTGTRAWTDRYAIVGFALGVLSFMALLTAASFIASGLIIRLLPLGLGGPGVILSLATLPVSLVGYLLSSMGRFSSGRRGLAVAGIVLSLATAFLILGSWMLVIIAVFFGSHRGM